VFHAGGDTEAKINKTMPYSISFRPLSLIYASVLWTAEVKALAIFLIGSPNPFLPTLSPHVHLTLSLTTQSSTRQGPMQSDALDPPIRPTARSRRTHTSPLSSAFSKPPKSPRSFKCKVDLRQTPTPIQVEREKASYRDINACGK
jgi:hypothetical protein